MKIAAAAAVIIGWLFTIIGWMCAIVFGLVSLYSFSGRFGPYTFIILSLAIPLCLVGIAAGKYGRSISESLYPRPREEFRSPVLNRNHGHKSI
jgi:hypothetical protein